MRDEQHTVSVGSTRSGPTGERSRQGPVALAAGAAGLIGLSGGADSLALLAWLALAAPAIGALAGGHGLRLWPAGWIVPALWTFALVLVETVGAGHGPPRASLGLAVVAGLFFLGLGLGQRAAGGALRVAGLLLLLTLALATAATWGGWAESAGAPSSGGWGRVYPVLGRLLLDVSPLVVVLESAGLDWTHAHPIVYAHGGVEWVPRVPYRGALAGPVVLLVGSLFARLVQGRGRTRSAGP